jgi:hypothetical protein
LWPGEEASGGDFRLSINLASMRDACNVDNPLIIVDQAHNAIVANPYPITF